MSVQVPDTPDAAASGTVEIPLTRGYVTVIDDVDRALTDGRTWSVFIVPHRRVVYAGAKIDGKTVYLHKLLCPEWAEVDHADGDGLNNRRSNLRDGTGPGKNHANREMQRNNTSGFKGVSWNKLQRKWVTGIKVNGKRVHLGTYGTPEEAADAYDQAAVRYFGEYAKTNAMLGHAAAANDSWQHHPPEERTHPHELTPENTYTRPNGKQECRQCIRERKRKDKSKTGSPCPLDCVCGRHRQRS